MLHLLKWQYQPDLRTKSWETTVSNCRDQIQDCLKDTTSLQRFLQDPDWVEKYYRRGRRDAAKETQKPLETFPVDYPYTIEQLLEPEFRP
ncbi:MAG: DUF29 domain-containing protein [Phormidium tanganyikae FI6-MK23]|jgi:hypothetical protein|nr:DUF29 domain-containing protein [Phormidium tanganyikae FI6-MK23]